MAAEQQAPTEEILSPVAGTVIDISEVPDPVFAGRMVGEGFGISSPATGPVRAPVTGKITMVADTGHAIGFRTESGLDVLVHLGIDTVELKGEPFSMDISKGDQVSAGDQIGTMDTAAIEAGGKDTTVIVVMTNTKKKVAGIKVSTGQAEAAAPAAVVTLKVADAAGAGAAAGAAAGAGAASGAQAASSSSGSEQAVSEGSAAPGEARQPQVENAAAPADATEAESEERPGDLTGYDALAWDILNNIGGKRNVRSVTHCITRVRFYLKDQDKPADEVVSDLDGVIDVVRAGGQYQVVIGPAVEDVYNAVVKQLGTDKAASSEDAAAEAAERPDTAWGWVKWGFSSLIGVITGSMIPVIGLLAAAGILKGILTLLKYYQLVDAGSTTFTIIDAMGDAVFYFLPIFVGFTAARRLGSDPIIVSIIGGVLAYPSIVEIASGEAERSILGMPLNAEFFGLPFHMASYTYSIFPMIVAAWVASLVEPWLKKVIPAVLRMIFVPLLEVVIVSLAIMLVLGPIVMLISGGIASAIQWLYDLSPAVSGLLIGGFYQCLVIFGLHWAVIPIVTQDISANGHSYLNAIISATMVAQGGAVLAVFLKTKILKIKELAGPAAISAFCGITEPAMYGVNLKYGRVFIMGSIGGAVGGFLTGLFNVNMWGFTGSLIGFFSFLNPDGIDGSLWGFLIASGAALAVSFPLTYFFGFRDEDVEKGREVKKVRLGNREPVQK